MKKRITAVIALLAIMIAAFTGCRESSRVSYNIGVEADNFNVTRRLEVLNARTDKPVFELNCNFSVSNNETNELEDIVEVNPGVYKKHLINLNEWTIYVIEDVSGAYVDKYHYEVNFLPEMIVPVEFQSTD